MLSVFNRKTRMGGAYIMNGMNNTAIGLDIAKNVFYYAELNRNGRVARSYNLKRNRVLSYFLLG